MLLCQLPLVSNVIQDGSPQGQSRSHLVHTSSGGSVRRAPTWMVAVTAALALFALLAAVLGTSPSVSAAAPPKATDRDGSAPHGLKGEYWTQSAPSAFDFGTLKATAFDPSLDFDNLEPRLKERTGQADDASVRWTGKVAPEKTGQQPSHITGDNGFRHVGRRQARHRPLGRRLGQGAELEARRAEGRHRLRRQGRVLRASRRLQHPSALDPARRQEDRHPAVRVLPAQRLRLRRRRRRHVQKAGRTLELAFAPAPRRRRRPASATTSRPSSAAPSGPLGTPRLDPRDRTGCWSALTEPVVGQGGHRRPALRRRRAV